MFYSVQYQNNKIFAAVDTNLNFMKCSVCPALFFTYEMSWMLLFSGTFYHVSGLEMIAVLLNLYLP